MQPKTLATATILITALSSAQAMAQTSSENKAAADKLYEEGLKAAIAGDFAGAVIQFQNGYKLDPDPRFLYNIGGCYERLNNDERAVDYYQRVLKSNNASTDIHTKASAKLRANQAKIAAIGTGTAISSRGDTNVVGPSDPNNPRVKTQDEGGFGGLGWAGVAIGAVGAGLMTASLIPNSGLSDQIQEYEDGVRVDPDPARDKSRYDAIQSKQSTGKLLLFSGAGLAVVGVGLVIVELATSGSEAAPPTQQATSAKAKQPTLQPLVSFSPQGAAVGFGLSF